jgi:hypothetical protein
MASLAGSDWITGPLSGPIVPLPSLQPLHLQSGGHPIWKCNNPEIIQGDGWLMTNSPAAALRQGSAAPLVGTFCVYLFHINRAGSAKSLHLLITNPGDRPVRLAGRGSMLTNRQEPLRQRPGTGLNHAVARDWLLGTPRTRFDAVVLAPGEAYQVDRARLGHRAMVEGRFEISADAGVYLHTVVTSSGTFTAAVEACQQGPAAGEIHPPGPARFGREAGICAHSVLAGVTPIEVPAAPAHLGLCLNTSNKFAPTLQDHTQDFLMRLGDSADRTYANYGHELDVTLQLLNPAASPRRLRLCFATNLVKDQDSPSFAFHGPIRVNDGVNDTVQDVYVRPTAPRQMLIDDLSLDAGAERPLRLQFFVPGLITIGHQLILEVLA